MSTKYCVYFLLLSENTLLQYVLVFSWVLYLLKCEMSQIKNVLIWSKVHYDVTQIAATLLLDDVQV